MQRSRVLLLALVAAAVVQTAYFYPKMPDPMASHFDGTGAADGHQSKLSFFLLVGSVVASTLVVFGGAGPLISRMPSRKLNVPHRDYWLAPEREAESRRALVERLERFGVATLLLLLAVLQLVLEANLEPEPRLSSSLTWWFLGLYFAFTVLWLVRLLQRFRRPPGEPAR